MLIVYPRPILQTAEVFEPTTPRPQSRAPQAAQSLATSTAHASKRSRAQEWRRSHVVPRVPQPRKGTDPDRDQSETPGQGPIRATGAAPEPMRVVGAGSKRKASGFGKRVVGGTGASGDSIVPSARGQWQGRPAGGGRWPLGDRRRLAVSLTPLPWVSGTVQDGGASRAAAPLPPPHGSVQAAALLPVRRGGDVGAPRVPRSGLRRAGVAGLRVETHCSGRTGPETTKMCEREDVVWRPASYF